MPSPTRVLLVLAIAAFGGFCGWKAIDADHMEKQGRAWIYGIGATVSMIALLELGSP